MNISESGLFLSNCLSISSFQSGSFRSDFVGGSFGPNCHGSFRPDFKGGSFRPDFRDKSFRPDLFILEKRVRNSF